MNTPNKSDGTLVASFPKECEDGQDVEVYRVDMPASFYRVRALAGVDSTGQPQPAFELHTGSGVLMRRLAYDMATAIADGMLILKTQ